MLGLITSTAWDGDRDNLEGYLKDNSLETKVNIEKDLESFNKKFGSLSKYKILLLHSGINNQEKYLRQIPKENPNLKIYLLSYEKGDYKEYQKNGIKVMGIYYAPPERDLPEESELRELVIKLTRN